MDVTKILEAILALAAAVITYLVIPWLKAKTTRDQQATMRALVKTAVYAAEQIYGSGKGEQKLLYARKLLESYGYVVDTAELEAAVYEYINGIKLLVDKPDNVDNRAE